MTLKKLIFADFICVNLKYLRHLRSIVSFFPLVDILQY